MAHKINNSNGSINISDFSTNKQGNLVYTFFSPINVDNGYTNTYKGDFKSSMELFLHNNDETGLLSDKRNGRGAIEWTVECSDMYACIGVWWEHGKVVDYDGVFDLPKQAAKLLKKFGVSTPKDFVN